ncbi:MAG: zf-HC2 domain-containing protein [Acidobacteria bacterium]|jgi:anti-sigma factor RsiW|nr:zf-HC2 domain-containing protein [Acidobacteriota bacterium]
MSERDDAPLHDGERIVGGLSCGEVLAALSDLVDGQLPQATVAAVHAHVAACDVCERFGGRFGALVAGLRGALREPEPLDPAAAARLAERLRGG